MSAVTEVKQVEKTPPYAWVCLVVSVLVAIGIVFPWMWFPGVTGGVFRGWLIGNSEYINPADPSTMGLLGLIMPNVMGLVPIGALIMAIPTTWIVRKWGCKMSTIIGLVVGMIATALSAATVTGSYMVFLVGRFLLGVGISMVAVSGPTCISIWFPDSTRGKAMAIWSCWAPAGIFISSLVNDGIYHMLGDSIATLQWFWCALVLVCTIIFIIVFRSPRDDERSQVSPERKPLGQVIKFFKNRSLWALILVFFVYNFINYGFTQTLKEWMQVPIENGGLGWDPFWAGLIGGLILACGVLAPIGGIILDRTARDKKYIWVFVGMISLTLCGAMAFFQPLFAPYIVFFCIGNMLLNACCRPLVPTYVFMGGQTAVAFGLSLLTIFQYIGQTLAPYALNGFSSTVTGAAEGAAMVDPWLAFMWYVPMGVIGIVLALFVKPTKKPVAVMDDEPVQAAN